MKKLIAGTFLILMATNAFATQKMDVQVAYAPGGEVFHDSKDTDPEKAFATGVYLFETKIGDQSVGDVLLALEKAMPSSVEYQTALLKLTDSLQVCRAVNKSLDDGQALQVNMRIDSVLESGVEGTPDGKRLRIQLQIPNSSYSSGAFRFDFTKITLREDNFSGSAPAPADSALSKLIDGMNKQSQANKDACAKLASDSKKKSEELNKITPRIEELEKYIGPDKPAQRGSSGNPNN